MYARASPLVLTLMNLARAASCPESSLSVFRRTPSIPVSVLPSGIGSRSRAARSSAVSRGRVGRVLTGRSNVLGVSFLNVVVMR
jgi:hypothetical protein